MGEKIRLKELEGDSDEIAKILNNSGCSLSDYLNISRQVDIKNLHYWGCLIGFVIVSILVWTAPLEYLIWRKVLYILQLAIMALCVCLTHMRFKAKMITMIAFVFGTLIMLVTLDVFSPQDAGKEIYRHGTSIIENQFK